MKCKYRFCLVVLMALLSMSCARQLAPVGHFQDAPVIADGNTDDWKLPLRFSDPSHRFQYSVTNDKINIYICILTKDEATELRMLRHGIQIYFDSKGEQNRTVDLEFPVRKPEQSSNYNGEPIRAADNKITKDQLLLQSDYFNTTGFSNIENGQFSVADKKNSIQVAIKLHDDSTLVYEAVVPMADIPGLDPFAKKTAKNFSVGLSVGLPRYRNNNYNNAPRSSYGMHGMRMGGNGNRYGQSGEQSREETIWYPFRFAFSQSNH